MSLINKELSVQAVASIVMAQLKLYGIWAVLVGGSCVTIYSYNQFMSFDLDFVSYDPLPKIKKALQELGFVYDKRKYFIHPNCDYFLDFVTPPVAIGKEPIHIFNTLDSDLGDLRLLTSTDCVKDRLAAYYYWDDLQSLDQAVCVAKSQKIDVESVIEWSNIENNAEKLAVFLNLIGL